MSEHTAPMPIAGAEANLVRRYVGALYDLAEEQGAIDAVCGDMRGLRRLSSESAEWRFLTTDPRVQQSAPQAVEQVIQIAGLNKLSANFMLLVASNRRLALLAAMAEGFLEEVATRRGEHCADIRAARPLSNAQYEALASALSSVMGGKVHINVVEDPSIIGGLTVKLGSQFIDASVKTRLDHLERTLKGAA